MDTTISKNILKIRIIITWICSYSTIHSYHINFSAGASTSMFKITQLIYNQGGRDSSAGVVTGYRLDGRGSILCSGKIFFFSTELRPALDPCQWAPGSISLE
jgi:hypothetical protein